MKPEEGWKKNFRGVLMGDIPFWDRDAIMCTTGHIRGDCFKDCTNKIIHVGKDKIPGDKKVGMKN